jgi:Spy/CpxP family protein refolding chaperone
MSRLCVVALLAFALAAAAQEPTSPCRGEELREIKALSPQEIDALLAGEGMGFAKAAELNGYPGPAHVLALAEELELEESQLAATREIERKMRSAAVAAGRELVAAERELNRLFATRTVTSESLQAALENIAALRAELRSIHLEAHLEQAALLTPAQIRRYTELRGYGRPHEEREHPH